MRNALLLVVLAAAISGALSAAEPPPKSGPLRVSWGQDATIEPALNTVAKAVGGKLTIVCDSYPADDQRPAKTEAAGTADEVLQELARAFGRQLIRHEGAYLLRHRRWFDLSFAGARPKDQKPKDRPEALSLRTSGAGKETRLSLTCLRTTLSDLAAQLSTATGEKHRVALPLRVRRLSGPVVDLSPKDLRELTEHLFPDSFWRQAGKEWLLEERPNAAFTRVIAEEGGSHSGYEMLPRAALHTQVASELTPEQLDTLQTTGSLRVGWGELSPESRDLYQQWSTAFLDVIDRSHQSRDLFVDFSQRTTWGVEFVRLPNGGFRGRTYGRNPSGNLVIF